MNSSLSTEIAALRKQVMQCHQEKESWFQKAQALQHQLKEKILSLKDQQQSSKHLHQQAAATKKSRDAANQEVKLLVQQIKTFQESRKALLAKQDAKQDRKLAASNILHQIESLELKVETEALTSKQESRMMKRIHELKKQHSNQKELLEIFSQINQLSKAIAEKRKVATHHHEQLLAALKEKKSPAFLQHSREILGLRKQQEESFQKFLEAKQHHATLLQQLKEKSAALQAEQSQFRLQKQQALQKKQQALAALLREKEKAVEEKLRTKKKLTNEDLLVFQHS